jgi:hypothetical protein
VSVHLSVLALTFALLPLSDYAGRYAHGESVVTFTAVDGRLYVRPIDWSGRQPLERVAGDRFQMLDRPARTFAFGRDAAGRTARVDIAGMDENGGFRRLEGPRRPLERLAAGDGAGAWRAFRRRGVAPARALALSRRMFERRPSTAPAFLAFVEASRAAGRGDPTTLLDLGRARIAAGDRPRGRAALAEALRANPALDEARHALRMLEDADAAGLPFPFDAAYAPPTPAEIARVEAEWAARDLAPRDVRVEDRYRVEHLGIAWDVEIVSHLVHGSRHHGAILVPEGATPGGRGVILEVKGVSWDFFPLRVPGGSTALRILGEDAARFVIAMPGLRGETLEANGRAYRSEGDPAESWDGAADDALAFLAVALARTPAADPARITAFGRSRGGAVALLAGARDPRIARVLAWSAPSGWIEGMPGQGFTQREIVAEGLRRRSSPAMIGGQSVRTFLRRALEGLESLEQVRSRLIASSAEYFVRRLPASEIHQGLDDAIVEPANGRRLRDAAASAANPKVEVVFHPEGGHDLDPAVAWPRSKAFLLGAGTPR